MILTNFFCHLGIAVDLTEANYPNCEYVGTCNCKVMAEAVVCASKEHPQLFQAPEQHHF